MDAPPTPEPARVDPLPPEAFRRWYGGWDPLTPATTGELMAGFDRPWWVVGGWTIEAFTGVPREHEDMLDARGRVVDRLEHVGDLREAARDPPELDVVLGRHLRSPDSRAGSPVSTPRRSLKRSLTTRMPSRPMVSERSSELCAMPRAFSTEIARSSRPPSST